MLYLMDAAEALLLERGMNILWAKEKEGIGIIFFTKPGRPEPPASIVLFSPLDFLQFDDHKRETLVEKRVAAGIADHELKLADARDV